jgi:hypothetical protein
VPRKEPYAPGSVPKIDDEGVGRIDVLNHPVDGDARPTVSIDHGGAPRFTMSSLHEHEGPDQVLSSAQRTPVLRTPMEHPSGRILDQEKESGKPPTGTLACSGAELVIFMYCVLGNKRRRSEWGSPNRRYPT